MLVVLAILALTVSIVPIFFDNTLQTIRLQNSTHKLASALRLAQKIAVLKSRRLDIEIRVNPPAYLAAEQTVLVPLSGVKFIKLVHDTALQTDEYSASIRFYPDGSSTGGHITLSNHQKSYQIYINWLTGHVHIQT